METKNDTEKTMVIKLTEEEVEAVVKMKDEKFEVSEKQYKEIMKSRKLRAEAKNAAEEEMSRDEMIQRMANAAAEFINEKGLLNKQN